MAYTFVNLTDKTSLDAPDFKLMRAHVTRSNFAQRRKQIAKRILEEKRSERHILHSREGRELIPRNALNPDRSNHFGTDIYTDGLMLTTPTDPNISAKSLLHQYRPLIFPAGTKNASGLSEARWVGLVLSEPALLEASLAISLRHRSGVLARQTSNWCAYRAVRRVNERLGESREKLTDGLIAAVFTLSYSEFLQKNEVARNIHVNGLAQMILLRRSQGDNTISPWMRDFFLHDCVSKIISSSEGPYEEIADAIGDASVKAHIAAIADISQRIAKLRYSLDLMYNYPTDSSFIVQEIDKAVASILHTLETLPGTEEVSYLSLLARAIRIFICLLWPPSAKTLPSDLADELRHALGEPKMRLCSSINLTVWQIFVGAVAADLGSETRTWYMDRLKKIFMSMRVFDWQAVIVVLEKGFMPPVSLLDEFRHIWEEIRISTDSQK